MSETWAVSIDLRDAYLVERQRDLTLFWVNKLGFLVNKGKSQLIPTQFPAEKRVVKVSGLAEPSAGKDLAEALRTSVQSTRVSPHGGDSHSSYPAYAPQPVDAGLGQPIPPNIPGPRVAQGIGVVGITGQPDGRPSVPQARSDYDDSYGCLHGGLGRSPRRLGDLGPVVVGLGQTPHQLTRAPGSIWLTLQHFLPQVRDTAVDVLMDNSTTVAYINKEGGTQSPTLCYLALDLWAWCRQHGIYLVANHISGVRNVLADVLSRGKHNHPTEWSLHKTVVQLEHWPTPHVDLFALEKNHKLPVFFSVRPSQTSSVINALMQNWESLYGYAYPSTNLIPRVLRKLRLQWSARILLVAPFWPSQPWFRQLTSMLTDLPRMVTPKDNLLKNSVTGKFYPKPDRMRLAVWPLSANPSLTEGFHRELQRRQPGPGESRLAGFMIPVLILLHYRRWCVERGVCPAEAPVVEVAEFLNGLRTVEHKGKPLAPSTIAGYKSAAIHKGFPNGTTVSSNTDLSTLIKGLFVVSARPRHSVRHGIFRRYSSTLRVLPLSRFIRHHWGRWRSKQLSSYN